MPSFLIAIEGISIVAAALIGYMGMAIICWGAFKGWILFIVCQKRKLDRMTEIRVDLAKHLSLGLEFLVAKDIIETLIRPTMEQLILLGVLIVIRTGIAFVLSRELREAVQEIEGEKEFEEAVREYEDLMRSEGHNHK